MQIAEKQRIVRFLEDGASFLAYALPSEREITVISADDERAADVRISFFGKNAPVVRLADCGDMRGSGHCSIMPVGESTSRDDYSAGVSRVIDHLRSHGGKTVVSRVISCSEGKSPEWNRIIDNLFDSADINSFRFIFFTPYTAGWMGVSPELLLEVDAEGRFRTMALAGTRRADDGEPWDDKNIEEHRMVVDYIAACFRQLSLEPEISEAQTVTHGRVRHLRHMITARHVCDGDTEQVFEQLLAELNPTPALAGWPVMSSLEQIASVERHPRYCYGGYVSVKVPDGRRLAYVNLRSCHFFGDRFSVYCGGGITSMSDVASEWIETEHKSRTIMAVLGR